MTAPILGGRFTTYNKILLGWTEEAKNKNTPASLNKSVASAFSIAIVKGVKMGFFEPNIKKMEAKKDIQGLINILNDKDEDIQRRVKEALNNQYLEHIITRLSQTFKHR